jgi:HSP20 family protein
LTFRYCKNFSFSAKKSAYKAKIYGGIYFVIYPVYLIFNQIKKEAIMTILKRNGNLQNHFPTLFDDFFNRDIFNWGMSNFSDTNTTIPAVNIKETSDNYEVEVAAPGMAKKDFKVLLEGNSLTISSEKSVQKEQSEEVRYATREFSYQSFSRTFTLQKDVVDTEKIQAKYEDGVLHLLIPKREHAKQNQPKLIEIL